jgi:hypothetical protein
VSEYVPPAGTRAHEDVAIDRVEPLPEIVPFQVVVTFVPVAKVNPMAVGVTATDPP